MRRRISIVAAGIVVVAASILGIIWIFKNANFVLPPAKNAAASLPGLLNYARERELKNDLLEAKDSYQKLINEFSGSAEVGKWQKKVDNLNMRLLFSPVITPKSIPYQVKPGDNLTKVAREFKTTADLIRRSNNIADNTIFPGQKIKIWTAPFSIVVDKSQNILILKADEEVFKTYAVSTGKNNCSPVGSFKIVNKLIHPTWFKAGAVVPAGSPENILGTRWLGIDLPGYGIHGTTEPKSLGTQATQGCIRMANADVEELYTIIPEGTQVVIVD